MDFNGYEKIEDMIGFEGFISPDGKFYKSNKIGFKQKYNLEKWIYKFLEYTDPELDLKNVKPDDFVHPYKYSFLRVVEDANKNNVKGIYNSLDDYNNIQLQLLLNLQKAYEQLNQNVSLYDFKTYKAEDMLEYVGFINPDGKFYRVRKKDTSFLPTHLQWSYEYCKTHNIKIPNAFKRYENIDSLFVAFEYLISKDGLNFLAFCEDTINDCLIAVYDKTHNFTQIQEQALINLNELVKNKNELKIL